jgi:hypothetical protein
MCLLDAKRPLSRAGRSLLARWSVPQDRLTVGVERENMLVLSGPVGTLFLAQRHCPVGQTARDTQGMLSRHATGRALKTFESTANGVLKFGYVLMDRNFVPERLGLHAFTITGPEYLELGFYLVRPADLPWALGIWHATAFGGRTSAPGWTTR